MLLRFPKDDATTHWTSHVKDKMVHYGLGEGRIRRVIKNGARREVGVAPNTIAVMQRNDTPKRKEEIWVMLQEAKKQENKKAIEQENRKALKQVNTATTNQKNKKTTGPEDLLRILQKPKMTIISAWRYPGVSKPGKAIPIPEDILAELDDVL